MSRAELLIAALTAVWGLWVALVLFVITFALWLARFRDEAADEEVCGRSRSALTPLALRRWFFWALAPAERRLAGFSAAPDLLSWAGLALAIGAGVLVARGMPGWAALSLAFAGVCDALDGRVARRRGQAGERGAFVDSSLDRVADIAVFAGILSLLSFDRELVMLTFLAATGTLLFSCLRARGEALGVTRAGGFARRPGRVMILVIALALTPAELAMEGIGDWPLSYYLLTATLFFLAGATFLGALERFIATGRELAGRERAGA